MGTRPVELVPYLAFGQTRIFSSMFPLTEYPCYEIRSIVIRLHSEKEHFVILCLEKDEISGKEEWFLFDERWKCRVGQDFYTMLSWLIANEEYARGVYMVGYTKREHNTA